MGITLNSADTGTWNCILTSKYVRAIQMIYLIYYTLTCRDKGEVKVRTDINVKEIVKAMSPNTPAPPASAWDEGLTITMECQVTYSFLLQY